MSKKQPKGKKEQPKKKQFNPDDYARPGLPRQEVQQIKQAFDIFDTDQSGMIDPQQLKQAFIKLGFSGQLIFISQNKFVYQILAQLDQDQSGGIQFPQFLRLAISKISNKDSRAEIKKVFNCFDPDRKVKNGKQGKINLLDLKKIAHQLGQEMEDKQIQKMFNKADLDQDGFVTQDDFYNIMTHKVYWD